MRIVLRMFCLVLISVFLSEKTVSAQAMIESEFLYENAPFANAHSNTIIETLNGDLLVASFGGTKEGAEDVCIRLSRKTKGSSGWSAPKKMVEAPAGMTCYNPVLYQLPADKGGEILFFYKIAPAFKYGMSEGYIMRSSDGGHTWGEPLYLDGLVGACKNQPVLVGNRLIAPSSGPSAIGWSCHFEISDDLGYTWRRVEMTDHNPSVNPAQPALLVHDDGKVQALFRTSDGHIATSWSSDNGETWTREEHLKVRNNNSGIDAKRLSDGRFVLIYNDTGNSPGKNKGPRTPLCLAVSEDGVNWKKFLTLEDAKKGEYSYPTIIQGADGDLRAIYTYFRRERAKYVRVRMPEPLDPSIYHDDWIDFNKNGRKDVYEDPTATIDQRVADLKSQMTQDEIKEQLKENPYSSIVLPDETDWPPTLRLSAVHAFQRHRIENTRLGIPALFSCYALRGVHHENTTNFPSLLTLGATWNASLVAEVAGTIALEAASLGYNSVEYPCVNHIYDPFGADNRDSYGESENYVQVMTAAALGAVKAMGMHAMPFDWLKRRQKRSVDDVLRMKFEAGLFDNPFRGDHETADNSVHHKAQLEVAKKAAAEGLVLLKNEGNLLPLSTELKKIALIGPNSSEVRSFYSEAGPVGTKARTILRAMTNLLPDVEVIHAVGCNIKDPEFPASEHQEFPLTETETSLLADAVNAVKDAELAIVVIGGNNDTNRRTTLELSGRQELLLEAVASEGKPVIAVMLDNRAAAMDAVNKYADAILHAWYPGEMTSDVIVSALLGKINPGGRLPVTMPSRESSVPLTFPLRGANDSKRILYPFGFGLSYTQFEIDSFRACREADGDYIVEALVHNVGRMNGDEVVQVYMADRNAFHRKQLVGFSRVNVEAGSETLVKIEIPSGIFTVDPESVLCVGSSSEDIKYQVRVADIKDAPENMK